MPHPFFHKLILSTTLQHKKLRIPDDFVTKFDGEIPVAAALTGPDGRVWRVGIRLAENKVWFQDGWEEFMEGYHIRVGCVLVFRYEGKSCFVVSIFNLYNSEIDYQANALVGTRYTHRKQYPFEELEDDESISPELQNLFSETKLNDSMNRRGEIDFQISQCMNNQSFRGAELLKPKKSGRKKQKLDHPMQDSSSGHEEAKVEKRVRFYASASARKRTVTSEEREKTVNTAKSFEPSNPFCRVVLRPSYVYRGCIMYLPSGFAEKYLSGVPDFIKLQVPDGRQWSVRCLYRPLYRGGRAKFSQGWYEFALQNNLCEGDVCIFELLRSNEFVLKVTIFRVSENAGLMHQSRYSATGDKPANV